MIADLTLYVTSSVAAEGGAAPSSGPGGQVASAPGDQLAQVAAVADDLDLLDAWRGSGPAADLVAAGSAPRPAPLADEPRLLLRTIDDLAVETARQLDWRRVRRARVALLRGLARHPRTQQLLQALAATGLVPGELARLHLGDLDGVEVELTRPDEPAGAGAALGALTRASHLAAVGRELLPAPVAVPRVAVAGLDAPWIHAGANVHHVDERWEHDPALLREASPTVVLAAGDALAGPLAPAVAAARDFGASVVAERAPTGPTTGSSALVADATLQGLVPASTDDLDRHDLDRDEIHQVWAGLGRRLGRSLVVEPRVLVVALPTRDPGHGWALADYDQQRHVDRDLVVVGEGDGLSDGDGRLPDGAARLPATASVADVLAHARHRGATLMTLFEAHARYGADHLRDLVGARRRSRADVVLRAAELHLDVATGGLRHLPATDVEADTRTPDALALVAHVEDLTHLDQRAEMRTLSTPALAEALLSLGARAHRTHGRSLASTAPAPAEAIEADPALQAGLALPETG